MRSWEIRISGRTEKKKSNLGLTRNFLKAPSAKKSFVSKSFLAFPSFPTEPKNKWLLVLIDLRRRFLIFQTHEAHTLQRNIFYELFRPKSRQEQTLLVRGSDFCRSQKTFLAFSLRKISPLFLFLFAFIIPFPSSACVSVWVRTHVYTRYSKRPKPRHTLK